MHVVVLTGASGSGKTTIARTIGTTYRASVDVYHFDAIGVPSLKAMIEGWGSGEAWQRAMTLVWLKRIASEVDHEARPILLEGQMRVAFVQEGLEVTGLTGAQIILLDCDDQSRESRLIQERQQPELANLTMKKWADYLRHEARAANIEVVDTGRMSVAECVRLLGDRLGVSDELRES